MLEASIVQRLAIDLDRVCGRQDEVDAGWLVMWVGPPMDGAALNTDVAGFHVDRDAVIKMAIREEFVSIVTCSGSRCLRDQFEGKRECSCIIAVHSSKAATNDGLIVRVKVR
jgi:hypothetical protein